MKAIKYWTREVQALDFFIEMLFEVSEALALSLNFRLNALLLKSGGPWSVDWRHYKR